MDGYPFLHSDFLCFPSPKPFFVGTLGEQEGKISMYLFGMSGG